MEGLQPSHAGQNEETASQTNTSCHYKSLCILCFCGVVGPKQLASDDLWEGAGVGFRGVPAAAHGRLQGLEPKFGYFVTKPAEAPKQAEKEEVVEEVKVDKAKKDLAEGEPSGRRYMVWLLEMGYARW